MHGAHARSVRCSCSVPRLRERVTGACMARKRRVCAGQAVVQFAKDARTERKYAIKFFAMREAFADEAAVYEDASSPLARLLPRVHAILGNEDGSHSDSAGEPLPPCIIMECGESLNLWSRRNRGGLDHMTALQVRRARMLLGHGAGAGTTDGRVRMHVWPATLLLRCCRCCATLQSGWQTCTRPGIATGM
jgi:hypothetical protein